MTEELSVTRIGIPSLIGWERDGSPIWDIKGGAGDIYYRDRRQPFLIADSATSVTLSTTQKTLWAVGATSPTILPANFWTLGRAVKITANLKWTAVANTNAVTIGMCYGAADAPACNVVATAVTPVSGTSTFSVNISGYAECRSIGSSGTLSLWGVALAPAGLTTAGPITFPSAGVTVVSTIDTTSAANALSFQALRATAGTDTVVATNIIMEALN